MAFMRNWFNKKISETAESVVEPVKDTVKATVKAVKEDAEGKVGLLSKIVVLAVEIFVGYKLISGHSSDDHHSENRSSIPGTIIINNYIDRKEQQS